MRDAMIAFRQVRQACVAFLEHGGEREYYLASAADRVFLMPTSSLDLTGVASYEVFLRGALDKIGAYPDFLHVGDYKTAVNQLTEKGFTPAHREMSEALNRDMYKQLVAGIADARKKTAADVRATDGPGPVHGVGGTRGRAGGSPRLRGRARRSMPATGPRAPPRRSKAVITSGSGPNRLAFARGRVSRCSTWSGRSSPARAASTR